MATAFNFHNILPYICRSLDNDPVRTKKALYVGTLIGLVMNLAWLVTVLGALPLVSQNGQNILQAFEKGLPATIPLSNIIGTTWFSLFALVFGLMAISTSYLSNVVALKSFLADLLPAGESLLHRLLPPALTYLPPLLVAYIYPDLFLKALNLVGGVGIALLFGIMPGVLALNQANSKYARRGAKVLIAAFSLILLLELGQEAGLFHIDPQTELYQAGLRLVPKQSP